MKSTNRVLPKISWLIIIISLGLMIGCSEKATNTSNVITDTPIKTKEVDVSIAKVPQTQPLVSDSLIKSDSRDVFSISETSIIVVFLIVLNIFTFLALFLILRWRRVVSSGMEAIVPSGLINSLNKFSSNQISLAKWLEQNISNINLELAKQNEAVSILKKELSIKDDELSKFKQLNLNRNSEILISKVVKLHSNLTRLSTQINSGLITQDGAIIFLRGELSDVFEELGISEISPVIGLSVKDLPSEGFTIKSTVSVTSQNKHLTVAELIESGYVFSSNGHVKVIRPAIIIVNKFGE